MNGAPLDVVSAYEPVPKRRTDAEQQGVRLTSSMKLRSARQGRQLRAGRGLPGQGAGVEVKPHATDGDPADAIITVAERSVPT